MPFLSKYGVARHIYVPLVKRSVVDFAVSADWTPATGDVKISKDGGAFANVTNLPAAIASANTGAVWDFLLTATEMQCAQAIVVASDAATKAVEDQAFIVETYGNASGQHVLDLGTTVEAQVWDATASSHVTVGTFGALNRIISSGQAQAGASTTITLKAGDSATDDIYNGRIIALVSGTGRNQYRIVSDYVGSTKVLTVETAWKTIPDSTSRYVIL